MVPPRRSGSLVLGPRGAAAARAGGADV